MIHVGFVVDNNYCKYLAVTLASILKSSSEKDDYTSVSYTHLTLPTILRV